MKSIYYIINVLSLIIFGISLAHAGKIYKWVDENGLTQFGSTPPPKQASHEYKSMGLRNTYANERVSQGQVKIYATWYANKNGQKYALSIGRGSYHLGPAGEEHESKLRNSGPTKISDTTIAVTYQHNTDASMIGKTEKFYIRKLDSTELVLVSDLNNKSYIYRREDIIAKQQNSVSGMAREMIGVWKGIGGAYADSLELNTGKFIWKGNRKEELKTGTSVLENGQRKWIPKIGVRHGIKYQGYWSVDDPYLILNVHQDFVYKLEETQSMAGSEFKLQILDNNAERMVLLNTRSHKKWTLVKIK